MGDDAANRAMPAAAAPMIGPRSSLDPGPPRIDRPVMRQVWGDLTFLHWAYDPAAVQRLLPAGLEAETMAGAAWVGLVPFFMHVELPVRALTFRFAVTNVRTYVRNAAGRSGVWFFSLDAAMLTAVLVARALYNLPYFWSDMDVRRQNADVVYGCRRRWPHERARSRIEVTVGDEFAADELSELDRFLTARFVLFSGSAHRRRLARVWHQPWPLHHARVAALEDELVVSAGLPRPSGEPLAHFSPGVAVDIGRPTRAGRSHPAGAP